ncbi:hypothetical protein EJB05_18252, partial [Eragrostis curvula]
MPIVALKLNTIGENHDVRRDVELISMLSGHGHSLQCAVTLEWQQCSRYMWMLAAQNCHFWKRILLFKQ